VRTPGCFVANISDELYMPILNVGPQQPSPPKDLECVPKINHQPKQATSNFNTGRDIPDCAPYPMRPGYAGYEPKYARSLPGAQEPPPSRSPRYGDFVGFVS
jgi:hypothetical protein